jgi:hypothetical protein
MSQVILLLPLMFADARAQDISVNADCGASPKVTVTNTGSSSLAANKIELRVVYAQYELDPIVYAECDTEKDTQIASKVIDEIIYVGGSVEFSFTDLGINVPTGCETFVTTARASVLGTTIMSEDTCATDKATTDLNLVDCTAEPFASLIRDDILFTNRIDLQGFQSGYCLSENIRFAAQLRNRPNLNLCGNGVCNAGDGEDCVSCQADCNGEQSGNPANKFCCGDGDGIEPVPCDDDRCTEGSFECIDSRKAGGSGTDYEVGIFSKYICSGNRNVTSPCVSGEPPNVRVAANAGSIGTGRTENSTDQNIVEVLEPDACFSLGYKNEINKGGLPNCCTEMVTQVAVQCAFFAVTRVGADACLPAFLSPETRDISPAGTTTGFSCSGIQPDPIKPAVPAPRCELDDDLDGAPDACSDECNHDGVCDSDDEICGSCPFDCTAEVGGNSYCCGDGKCEPGESCGFCGLDCEPAPCCGDGFCEPGEDINSCAADCTSGFCGDGVCDLGEDCNSCPNDCISGSVIGCGNNVCEPGEDCLTCPEDCRGVQGGNPANRYCCVGDFGTGDPISSDGENPVPCSFSFSCQEDGFQCSTTILPELNYCCGDGVCNCVLFCGRAEDETNCAVDCGPN